MLIRKMDYNKAVCLLFKWEPTAENLTIAETYSDEKSEFDVCFVDQLSESRPIVMTKEKLLYSSLFDQYRQEPEVTNQTEKEETGLIIDVQEMELYNDKEEEEEEEKEKVMIGEETHKCSCYRLLLQIYQQIFSLCKYGTYEVIDATYLLLKKPWVRNMDSPPPKILCFKSLELDHR